MSREDETNEKICCTGSLSPLCLGITDYNCCGDLEPICRKVSLLKKNPEKLKPFSSSAYFNNTVCS